MRFIGSKTSLLSYIDDFILESVPTSAETFCDLFSGTASVARYFKSRYRILSNDTLYMSYVIQRAVIQNNKHPNFKGLSALGIDDVLSYFNDISTGTAKRSLKGEPFVLNNYSPASKAGRMYLTEPNALKVDFIRQQTESWKMEGLITEDEYFYLIAVLVEAIPYVSNITGTYGAYLKHWDKRALNDIKLNPMEVVNGNKRNESFNEDANRLLETLKGDILYIDPPYNSRQYEPNYHLLETVALYDNPEVYGVTGMRPYLHQKSDYCLKMKALPAMRDLIEKAKFEHIVISYSSDGIMTKEEIGSLLRSVGKKDTYRLKEIPYRKYKSKIHRQSDLYEYLFYVQKEKI